MLYRRKFLILLGCLLFLLFVLYNRGGSAQKPWTQNDAKDGAEKDGVISFTDEMNAAVKDPLQYYATQSQLESFSGVLSPIANSTYVMLYAPAPTVYSSVPLHQISTLKRFPYFDIYSETGAKLGANQMVTDVVADLPLETIKTDPRLNSYRIQRFGRDNNFDWPIKDYWKSSIGEDSLMELLSINMLKRAYKSAPETMKWFVLMDETTYISSTGLEGLLANLNPAEKIVRFGDRSSGKGRMNMILSRPAVKALIESNGNYVENMQAALESMQGFNVSPLKTRNISTLGIERTEWCKPEPALFTDLSAWEIQTLYHREMRYQEDSTSTGPKMRNFYYDFIMPYMKPLITNWVVYPSESHQGDSFSTLILTDGNKDVTLHTHAERDDCERLCKMTQECLAWQWRKDTECKIETKEVRRGMELNPKYKNWEGSEHQLFVSGWMIDRIRKSRLDSSCDTMGDANNLFSEGWFDSIKRLIKVEHSNILQSIEKYE